MGTPIDDARINTIFKPDLPSNVPPQAQNSFLGGTSVSDLINSGVMDANGGVQVASLLPGSLMDIQGWSFSGVFSATNSVKVAWTAGTITLGDGTTFSIVAGDTGNMANTTDLHYIYFDKNISTTVLQNTTNSSTAVGGNKILIAVCKAETSTNATLQAFGGKGLGTIITTDNMVAGSINGDRMTTNTLDAGVIKTGSLVVGTNVGLGTAQTAGQVTTIVGNTVTTGYVNALGITAGSVAAENITGTTITGKQIQSSSASSHILIDNGTNIYLYSEDYASNSYLSGNIYVTGQLSYLYISGNIGIYQSVGTNGYAILTDGDLNCYHYSCKSNSGLTGNDSFVTRVAQSKSGGNVTNVQVYKRAIAFTGGILTTFGNETGPTNAE